MDSITKRKLTAEERKIIEDIESRAKKRKHKKKYNVKFIINWISDHGSVKEWNYNCRQDVIDMLESIAEIALKMGIWKKKEAKEYIEYYTKEYANVWFEDEISK